MNNIILLSIIIPVYNVEDYLEKCLDSIVKQINEKVEKSIEVLVINDGSTDNSEIIAKKYCKKYQYIHVYNQENQGVSAARNKGALLAEGKYLFFLDSDDYMLDILQELLDTIKNTNVDFILGKKDGYVERFSQYLKSNLDFETIGEYSNLIVLFEKLSVMDFCWFTTSLIIIKRTFFLEENLFFKEGILHEDELWVPLVFLCSEEILLFNKSVYCYRIGRLDSIMNSINIDKEFDQLIIADEFSSLLEKSRFSNVSMIRERRAFLEWRVINSIGKYKGNPLSSLLKRKAKERIRYLKHGKYMLAYVAVRIFGVDAVRIGNAMRIYLVNKIRSM